MLAAATLLPFGGASAQTVDAAQRIAEAANRFLASLDDGQRQQALIAFESDNRLDWHYIPRSRSGPHAWARCSPHRPTPPARCSPRC